jgi:Ca-activated chloride channel family protein
MVEVNFSNPEYLWFLFSLPVLIIVHSINFRKTQKKALKFANFEAISRITGSELIKKNIYLLIFRLVTLVLVILAVSGTSIIYKGLSTSTNYILSVDSSASMLVDDIFPSRLDSAKQAAVSFLNFLPETTKVGLVSFSGTVFIESLLETDFEKLKNIINSIQVSQVGGTDLGNTIITGTNILITDNTPVSRVIVLITDGQSNIGLPLKSAVEYALENKIIIHTIGIGTEEGGRFVGTDVISTLDEANLKNIADISGGNYFRAESKEKLLESFGEIARFNRKKISLDMTFSFMLIALLLLFIEWVLINTKNKIIP